MQGTSRPALPASPPYRVADHFETLEPVPGNSVVGHSVDHAGTPEVPNASLNSYTVRGYSACLLDSHQDPGGHVPPFPSLTFPSFLHASAVVAWAVLISPSIAFVLVPWKYRRDRLWDFFSGDILRNYYNLFTPTVECGTDAEYVSHFRHRFSSRYGRHNFLFPIFLLAVLSAIALWATANTVIAIAGHASDITLPVTAIASLLGAYMWIVWDQLNRFRSRDFTIHDLYGCSFRLVISPPVAYFIGGSFDDHLEPLFAFILGGVPTGLLFTIVRRTGGKRLGLDETSEDGPTELVKLQGVSRAVAERFQNEGITTIPQLAWTEPVDLAIRTNFDFDYVLDCQSQAILHLRTSVGT